MVLPYCVAHPKTDPYLIQVVCQGAALSPCAQTLQSLKAAKLGFSGIVPSGPPGETQHCWWDNAMVVLEVH